MKTLNSLNNQKKRESVTKRGCALFKAPVTDAAVQACAVAATQRYLRLCDDTIAEYRSIIADLEACRMAPQKKRRAVFNARCKLADLERAADSVRRAPGGTA